MCMKYWQKYLTCKEARVNSISVNALVVPHFLLATGALMHAYPCNSHEKLKGPGVLRRDHHKNTIRDLTNWNRAHTLSLLLPKQGHFLWDCRWVIPAEKWSFTGPKLPESPLSVPVYSRSKGVQISRLYAGTQAFSVRLPVITDCSCETLCWWWVTGYFVLKWLLQNTSLSHHLNTTSHADFQQLLELAENSRACHSEIKEGLAVRFQSALRERLNTLGGGSTCVRAHTCLPKQQMVSIKLLLLLGSGTSWH